MNDPIESLRAIAAYLAGCGNREDADFIISIVDRIAELEGLIASQRQTIEALCEGTDGSTPAIVQLARQDMCITELEAELSRYRWLRDQCGSGGLTVAQVREHGLDAWSGDDLDTAINRAAAPEATT